MSAASIFQLLPASLALIPLIITPGLLFYFDVTPKIIVLLIATGICLFFAKTNAYGLRAVHSSLQGRWLIYLVAGQAISILVATAFSRDLPLSVTGGAWRRSGMIVELGILLFTLLLAARAATVRHTARLALRSIAVSCLLTALYGIAQFVGIDPILPAHSYHAGEGIWTIVRTPSTMGNANFLANYLVYASLCSVALVSWKERDAWSWLGAVAFCAGMVAIVLSGTRSGILGLAAALAVLAIGANPRRRYWIVASCACAAALVAALAISPLGTPLKARVRWSREDALGGGRLLLWRDSARMIASRPLTGFGPDSFGREFPVFQSIELAKAHPDFYQESPHNALLDAATTAGVPGFLLAVAMLALGFHSAWRVRSSELRLALCLAAALAGGTVCAQFSPPVLVTRIYPSALIAILCALNCRPQPDRPAIARFVWPLYWAAGAVLLLFSFSLLASDVLAGSFQRAINAANIETAVQRYRMTRTYSLPGFDIDLYASRALAQLAMKTAPALTRALAWRESMYAGQRATHTAEDRQNAFFNLAQLCAQQNDVARTEQNLRAAIQIAPNWFKPHWILAELLMRTGRAAEAREEARVAMSMDAGKDPEVVRTWNALGSPR
jgi:O-antigen ligase